LFLAGGVVALAALFYFGPAGLPAPTAEKKAPRTHIALLNLSFVIQKYKKFEAYQEEIKKAFEPFTRRGQELKAQAEEVKKQLADTTLPAQKRDELETKLKRLQKAVEDNVNEGKAALQSLGDKEMKDLYLDIEDAARRHAETHDFEMVLHYNEAINREDLVSPVNIARKIQAGALFPLYVAKGLDISEAIVDDLNRRYQAGQNAEGRPGGP
jgi:Skp family chaperone for outer membrane proteins